MLNTIVGSIERETEKQICALLHSPPEESSYPGLGKNPHPLSREEKGASRHHLGGVQLTPPSSIQPSQWSEGLNWAPRHASLSENCTRDVFFFRVVFPLEPLLPVMVPGTFREGFFRSEIDYYLFASILFHLLVYYFIYQYIILFTSILFYYYFICQSIILLLFYLPVYYFIYQ